MKKHEVEPVTAGRIKKVIITAVLLVFAVTGAFAAGYASAAEGTEIPVLSGSAVVRSPEEAVTVGKTAAATENRKNAEDTADCENQEESENEKTDSAVTEPEIAETKEEVDCKSGSGPDEETSDEETAEESGDESGEERSETMQQPLDEMRMTSPFGYRWGRQHEGIDLGMAQGTSIYAAEKGTVTFAAYTEGYGNLVKIDHGNGVETYYAHCCGFNVMEGQEVAAGEVIAFVGSTGNSTGPHLHFEVRVNGEAQDPLPWIEEKDESENEQEIPPGAAVDEAETGE